MHPSPSTQSFQIVRFIRCRRHTLVNASILIRCACDRQLQELELDRGFDARDRNFEFDRDIDVHEKIRKSEPFCRCAREQFDSKNAMLALRLQA